MPFKALYAAYEDRCSTAPKSKRAVGIALAARFAKCKADGGEMHLLTRDGATSTADLHFWIRHTETGTELESVTARSPGGLRQFFRNGTRQHVNLFPRERTLPSRVQLFR